MEPWLIHGVHGTLADPRHTWNTGQLKEAANSLPYILAMSEDFWTRCDLTGCV